jgi:hypothetical protein
MYAMEFRGLPWGFTLTAVEERMEPSFDEALRALIHLSSQRTYVPRDAPERMFLAKHAPHVLEALKQNAL